MTQIERSYSIYIYIYTIGYISNNAHINKYLRLYTKNTLNIMFIYKYII